MTSVELNEGSVSERQPRECAKQVLQSTDSTNGILSHMPSDSHFIGGFYCSKDFSWGRNWKPLNIFLISFNFC
ncbi:hypothetical protein K1719_036812 [Acacia pycnantha]|nr:hypothetical protein K1719_036812 [Acacia pycnantha]